jgi:hypothetical protein
MRWVYAVRLRLRWLFRRAQVENELRAEFQYHLDRQIEPGPVGAGRADRVTAQRLEVRLLSLHCSRPCGDVGAFQQRYW